MNSEIRSILDRAGELLKDLEEEYRNCLRDHKVTERARNITHEVLGKPRSALDQTMMRAWEKYISPCLSDKDKNKRRSHVYFPISPDLKSFDSKADMADLHRIHPKLYDFLLSQQPFKSEENQWLYLLTKIVAEGKHVRLVPQKLTERNRSIKVSGRGSGSVSWDPSCVRFGRGVRIMNAPVDSRTQRIVPTPGVTEKVEVWVSFALEGYGVDSLGFCKEAIMKTRMLIEKMFSLL